MRPSPRAVLSLVLPVGLLLVACDAHWAPRDLHPSERLENLSRSDYRRICDAYQDHIRDTYDGRALEELVCVADAVERSDTEGACLERAERCMERMPEDAEDRLDDLLEEARCGRLDLSTKDCAATVGELLTCLDDLELALANVEAPGTCHDVKASFDKDWWKVPLPQRCRELRDRC